MKNKTRDFIPALRYNWLTRIYDPIVQYTMPEEKFKQALVNQADIREDFRVLDFGCGTLTLSLLAKKYQPSAYVHAVDVDEKILKIASEKLQQSGEEIFIEHYEGKVLTYTSKTFDRVISSLVFHHLTREQKQNSLQEIFRVLKSAGELHIADWGKAKNVAMRSAFYAVQLLDGFKTTQDNVDGLLPEYMSAAGFQGVTETGQFQTIFGTLSLYKAIKPNIAGIL